MSAQRWTVSSSETQEVSVHLSEATEEDGARSSLKQRCEIAEDMTELYQRQVERLTQENRKLRRRNGVLISERKRLHRLVRHLAAIVEAQSSVVFIPSAEASDTESTESVHRASKSSQREAFRLQMRYDKDKDKGKEVQRGSESAMGWNFRRKVKGGAVDVKLSWPPGTQDEAEKDELVEVLEKSSQEMGETSLAVDEEGSFELVQAYYE